MTIWVPIGIGSLLGKSLADGRRSSRPGAPTQHVKEGEVGERRIRGAMGHGPWAMGRGHHQLSECGRGRRERRRASAVIGGESSNPPTLHRLGWSTRYGDGDGDGDEGRGAAAAAL